MKKRKGCLIFGFNRTVMSASWFCEAYLSTKKIVSHLNLLDNFFPVCESRLVQ
jgi:hypothetical protein